MTENDLRQHGPDPRTETKSGEDLSEGAPAISDNREWLTEMEYLRDYNPENFEESVYELNRLLTEKYGNPDRITQLGRELEETEAKHAETIGEIFRNEVVPLKQQLAEARKDTERLEWLFERGLAWRDCYGEDWKEGEWLYMKHHARLTIDEAMKGDER